VRRLGRASTSTDASLPDCAATTAAAVPSSRRAAAAGPANFATGVKEIHRKRTPTIASAIAK
jgi:hypothetical protein